MLRSLPSYPLLLLSDQLGILTLSDFNMFANIRIFHGDSFSCLKSVDRFSSRRCYEAGSAATLSTHVRKLQTSATP